MSNTSTTVQTSVLSYFGLEIGIFTLATIFSSFFVLKAIKGDMRNLESFFAKKSWKFLSNDKAFLRYTTLFSIIVCTLLVIPIISLIIWGAMVLHVSDTLLDSNTAGISILLIGAAIILIAVAVLYIKWSYSKIRPVTIILGGLGLACYLAFQLFALFDQETPSFLGVSAVFLSINAIIMVAIGIMSYSDNKGSIIYILDLIKKTNNKEDAIDTKYNELPIEEQYEKLLLDPEYEVTEAEIKKYVTVATTREEFSKTILAGGLQSIFSKKSPVFKRIVLSVLYALSVGVLVAYAILVKEKLPERYLGWITAVAVITTDIIVFFITQLKISSGQTTLSLLIVGMRCFLFGFGGSYWFLGYCSLYLLLSIVIGWKMVEKRLPLETPLPKPKTKKPIYQIILNSPLFTYGIINTVFIIVVIVISTVDSAEIPLDVFRVLGKDYPQWAFGIASILISLTSLALMITFRYHQRRLVGMKDLFKFPFTKKEFAAYLVFVVFTYLFAVTCGALWYAIIDDLFVLLTALIIPPVILAIYVLYLNYKKNEYKILCDVKALNEKTKNVMEGQAKALEQIKSMGASKTPAKTITKDYKEEIETVLLKDDQAAQGESPDLKMELNLPEFLNFSTSKTKSKMVIHEDWRAQKLNFFQAFYKRKLMNSDYRIIFSIIFILGALLAYSIVIYAVGDEDNLKAWTVSVTLFVFVTIFLPLNGYFGALQTFNFSQIVLLILGIGGNYGYGIAAITKQFDEVEDNSEAIATVIYWFFLLPMLICSVVAIYDFKQKKWKRTLLATILGGIVLLHLLGLGVFFAIISIWAAAIVSWGLLIFILGAAGVYIHYLKNNRSFSRKSVVIGFWAGFGIIISIFIVSLCMDSFNDFLGFSLSYLAFLICYSIYAIKNFISDILNASTNPVFYSPWIFPIYKYDPAVNNLKNNDSQGYVSLSALGFFWLWSIAVVIWVRPVSIGISIGCLVEMIALLYFVYVTTETSNSLSIALSREDLFHKGLKKAWLQARNSYLEHKHVTKISNLVNFVEHLGEAQVVRKYIETTKASVRKEASAPQKVNPDPESLTKQKENKAQNIKKLYEDLGAKVKSADHELRDEFRLLIHFELLLVLTIIQTIRKEKVTLLSFINVRKAELREKGLSFVFGPGNMGIDAKYKLVIEKYESLNPTQKEAFDELRDAYFEQVKQEKHDANDLIKAQEEAKKERQKALAEKLQKNKTINNNQNMENLPIKDMPDSVMKYQKIAKEYSQGKKYEDTAFAANQNAVGSQLSEMTQKWDRPGAGYTLFGSNGVQPDDPRQGSIGNCYFVSALSVAGKDNIEKVFLADQVKQSPETGAFVVRFYFLGDPVDVIVDDLFPKDGQGNWSFCKSDSGNKLWPMILEKAYAKLHGGYDKIVAGKVSYALSELTGGYPEEMKMSVAQKNVDVFWNTIMKHSENGYLLGAGTPENPQGDRAISDEGIIQGHAYAILGLEEYNDERLIKLRNPHGSGGAEWRGDWGDNSIKWNEKAKKQLKFENKEDGIFWMSLDDFVYEFKSLYVCRIFDQKLWKTVPTIEGEWKGENAAGLPNKNNPGANLSKNPHYGIKVQRRCSVFISLMQVERIDMFRGKHPIMFLLQKNDGKRVKSASLDLLAGSSGAPTDLITVSAEISLEAPTYPYTFSLMVATANAGAEGKYEVNIQCTDDFTIVDLK